MFIIEQTSPLQPYWDTGEEVLLLTKEEHLNASSHGFGLLLGVAGLGLLMANTVLRSTAGIAFLIYGTMQVLLYLTSTATHLLTDRPVIHRVVRVLDQSAVYLFIAGTYTPVALLILPTPWQGVMLLLIWLLALMGVIMKSTFLTGKHLLSDLLYLPMGWMVILFLKPLITYAPEGFLPWVFAGGIAYSVGVIFYAAERIPYNHLIWHLFVLAGSGCFFTGFVLNLL